MRYYPDLRIEYKEPFYYVQGKRTWWFFSWWEDLADGYHDLEDAESTYMSAREWNGIDK